MVDLQVRPIVEALLDAPRDEIGSLLRVPRSDSRAAAAPTEHCARPVTRRPPQTADRRACRRLTITTVRFSPAHDLAADERLPGERPEPIPHRRSSAYASSSRELHRSTSTSPSPPTRDSVIVAVLPPRPERPENGPTAIVAPRCSSSSQTVAPQSRSARPGRSRAEWTCEASRPLGVRHGSPADALHVGQLRSRQPRATCMRVAGGTLRHGSRRHRVPGAARHSRHRSSSHARRSLTRRSGDVPLRPTHPRRPQRLGRPSGRDHFWQENRVSCQKSEKVPANA